MAVRPRFLGGDDTDRAASPIYNIQHTPPFLLAHGSEDFSHLMTQGEAMENALIDAGGDVLRIVFEGRNHFSASYAGGEADGPWVSEVLKWMETH